MDDGSEIADVLRFPVYGPGGSFSELLKAHAPELLPGGASAEGGGAHFDVPEGTTVLALRFHEGVIVAGDRRATEGFQIAHRSIEKVFAADDMSAVAIAGAAGPAVEMVRLFQTELEHYEKVEGVPLSLEGKGNKLGQMIRANLPAAMQGLVVVPLFCGFDHRRNDGRVFKYDVTGGRYEEIAFACTGSGSVHARNWIKAGYRDGMERQDAVDLGLLALFQAADEDSATGGPDLVRRIFPTVAVIDGDGFAKLTDDDVEQLSITLLQSGRSAL